MKDLIKNLFIKNFLYNTGQYTVNDEAVIISCYFNSENNIYRLDAFRKFYASIKHMNHYIVECVIGDAESQLPDEPGIYKIKTNDLLWHKEAILNKIVSDLPAKYKYVFWVDADVVFTNQNWLNDAVEQLQTNNLVQLFEYCVHLNQGEDVPDFDLEYAKKYASDSQRKNPNFWKSFASNYAQNKSEANSENYDQHGHVGFAWGARKAILELVPLYDKALVGGADHIVAHAAVGQIPCSCITKAFSEDIDAVNTWSKQFYSVVKGNLSYVPGNVYHLWHGDINKREYLKRIIDFTPTAKNITEKDENGLYTTQDPNAKKYVKDYFERRENTTTTISKPSNNKLQPKKPVYTGSYKSGSSSSRGSSNSNKQPQYDDGGNLITSALLGYATDSALIGGLGGGSLLGGFIGQELRDVSQNNDQNNVQGGGGDFGGGGAGGSWDDSNNNNTDTSQNFS